ncbi:MAG: dihydrolipoamide acetyltransferase family protein [Bacteroidales bacterium]|jgi:2-oxoglutarate dehydrogenase E2 component (dihydrolipoamide succinyltransferase)|nr:dihydrolipoamide acetyltransferase family protein [Bacteroidales bacterium]
MAKFEIVMPKLGESIIEATITKWLTAVGDTIEEDDAILEIATDKVDSEIPSPVDGVLTKIFFEEGDVVPVGALIAIINMDGEESDESTKESSDLKVEEKEIEVAPSKIASEIEGAVEESDFKSSSRFYSPLVKSIAKEENISLKELEEIAGSGKAGRVTKQDIINYLENRSKSKSSITKIPPTQPVKAASEKISVGTGDRVEEMGRMRKLIADHMVMSKQVSPHVTSFIEADVTKIVNWRNKVKDAFQKREGEKITYTPIFIDVAAKALRDYPGLNVSVDGNNIIYRKNIHIGMAAALPNGNLIVPVIKNADQRNLIGMAKTVNDLATRARANKLMPDEISGGTFTITNFGSFESLTGTPIINQPQVAILGLGAIVKRPVVIETPEGDTIGIRSIMMLSLAYDHRVVDGALAGLYLKRLREYIENFDVNQSI